MNKKSRMGSISCVQLDSNSIVGILEFSRIRERRMMSCVSLVYKETFDKTRESCTRIALKRLVEERRLRYGFPVVNNIYCPIVLCIPRGFEPRRILSYLIDQLLAIFVKEFKQEMSFNEFCDVVAKDRFMSSVALKLAFIAMIIKHEPWVTLRDVFYTELDIMSRAHLANKRVWEKNVPVWKHLEDMVDNEDRDVMAWAISICWNRILPHVEL